LPFFLKGAKIATFANLKGDNVVIWQVLCRPYLYYGCFDKYCCHLIMYAVFMDQGPMLHFLSYHMFCSRMMNV